MRIRYYSLWYCLGYYLFLPLAVIGIGFLIWTKVNDRIHGVQQVCGPFYKYKTQYGYAQGGDCIKVSLKVTPTIIYGQEIICGMSAVKNAYPDKHCVIKNYGGPTVTPAK